MTNDINQHLSENFHLSEAMPNVVTGSLDLQENCSISDLDVMDELNKLNLSKATPNTDLPTRLYKESKCILAAPLCNIFNTSLMTNTVPSLWKIAEIIPLPKMQTGKN